jgi:hypothetical protein
MNKKALNLSFINKYGYQDLKNLLLEFAQCEFKNIEKEKNNKAFNIPTAFTSIGGLGESIAVRIIPNAIGSASKGGCAHDITIRDENFKVIDAVEVKNVCLEGTKECKVCETKLPRFQTRCYCCKKDYDDNKSNFRYISDSRAGISASAHMKYAVDCNEIKRYFIFITSWDSNLSCIKINGFKFNCCNEYFTQYIKNQNTNGKGKSCNLLPYSRDWHLSGPIKILETQLTEQDVSIHYLDIENEVIEPIPYKNFRTKTVLFTKDDCSNIQSFESLKNEGNIDYESNIQYFNHHNKQFGKVREGKTSRK